MNVATRTDVISSRDSINRLTVNVAVGMHILSTLLADLFGEETAWNVRSFAPTTRKPRTMAMVFLGGGGGGGGRATSRRLLGWFDSSARTPGVRRVPYGGRRRRVPEGRFCQAWKAWFSRLGVVLGTWVVGRHSGRGSRGPEHGAFVTHRGWLGFLAQHCREPGLLTQGSCVVVGGLVVVKDRLVVVIGRLVVVVVIERLVVGRLVVVVGRLVVVVVH